MKNNVLIMLMVVAIYTSCKDASNPNVDRVTTVDNEIEASEGESTVDKKESKGGQMSPSSEKNKDEKKENDSERKMKNERNQLLEATRKIISENRFIPSFKIDSMKNRYEQRVIEYNQLQCNLKQYSSLNQFSIEFNQEYPNSGLMTRKEDGKIFCLRDLELEAAELGLIVYRRSEGGHTSDGVEMITGKKEDSIIYILPLSCHIGWDGHETEVESSIEGRMITRKITEKYGWSNLQPDALVKQPQRIVLQEIEIKANGEMEKISEKVYMYNMEELMKKQIQ